MGLNSRKAQIFWGIVPIITAGLALGLPFVWRALKTKKSSDIWTAAAFLVPQVVVYILFATDPNQGDKVSNLTGSVTLFCAIAGTVGAAYLYRPLNKEERMEQARNEQRPGSSFL